MKDLGPLEKFGEFIVENLRDKAIDFAEGLMESHWKAPKLIEVQNEITALNEPQKAAFKQAITRTVDNAMHDFLFALQERSDIQVLVDGKNIVELSDGIQGEAYSDEGWLAKYSRHNTYD